MDGLGCARFALPLAGTTVKSCRFLPGFVKRLVDGDLHRLWLFARQLKHRAKRSRAIQASPLDEIPGIGPSRKRALLLAFGTASKIRAAAFDDLMRTPGISEAVARKVYDFYHPAG